MWPLGVAIGGAQLAWIVPMFLMCYYQCSVFPRFITETLQREWKPGNVQNPGQLLNVNYQMPQKHRQGRIVIGLPYDPAPYMQQAMVGQPQMAMVQQQQMGQNAGMQMQYHLLCRCSLKLYMNMVKHRESKLRYAQQPVMYQQPMQQPTAMYQPTDQQRIQVSVNYPGQDPK